MKILLIVPTYQYKRRYPAFLSVSDFPTGFAYLSSFLKEAGHEVFGLNLNNITGYDAAYDMVANEINRSIDEVKPDLIGTGGLAGDYKFLKDAIKVIRLKIDTPIVLGGGIVTHDAEFIFNTLKPDYAIVGEAEEAMVKLADALSNQGDIDSIDNLVYWNYAMREVGFTKTDYNYKDINELPFPDYEPFGFDDMFDNYGLATRLCSLTQDPTPDV